MLNMVTAQFPCGSLNFSRSLPAGPLMGFSSLNSTQHFRMTVSLKGGASELKPGGRRRLGEVILGNVTKGP